MPRIHSLFLMHLYQMSMNVVDFGGGNDDDDNCGGDDGGGGGYDDGGDRSKGMSRRKKQ